MRNFADVTEYKICDQAYAIRKKGWLTEIELEVVKRRIKTTGPQKTD